MIRNELPYSKEDYYVEAQGNPELNIDITENGDYDVRKYATAKVNVSGAPNLTTVTLNFHIPDESVEYITYQFRELDNAGHINAAEYLEYREVMVYQAVNQDVTIRKENNVTSHEKQFLMLKPSLRLNIPHGSIRSVSGNATQPDYNFIMITGDCVIDLETEE